MSIEIQFGQLRSLVLSPSFSNWRMLCGVLDRYEDQWGRGEMAESVLPYLRHHIERWPTSVRRYATHTWLHRAMLGREVKQLEFATAIHFVGHQTTTKGLELLFQATNLERVTHVDMRKAEVCDASVLRTLLDNPVIARLESLTLRSATLRRLPQSIRHELASRELTLGTA